MNEQVKPQHEVVGADDLMVVGNDAERELIIDLVNLLSDATNLLRCKTQGGLDAHLITALITYAGCIHGELLTMGMVHDATNAATDKLLQANWYAGVEAGKCKVARMAAELGKDPAA